MSNKPNFSNAKISSDEESDNDLDLVLDVNRIAADEKVILNKRSTDYGMEFGDYVRMLILDNEERETLKRNKELELEKSQYSGRKSRRERRLAKEKRLREKGSLSPLSFIVTENKEKKDDDDEGSRSSSCSSYRRKRKGSESPTDMCFITSFGQDAEEEANATEVNSIVKGMNYAKTSKIETLKRLKQNICRSMSRSKSKSPVASSKEKIEFKKKNVAAAAVATKRSKSSSSSNSDSSSDEDKAYEKYLKRKENRTKYEHTDKSSPKKVDRSLKFAESTSSKARSSEDFKLMQEKLKKKMKKDIDRQIKKDRKLEKEKRKKEEDERREREAKLEYLSEKIKGLRKKDGRDVSSSSSDSSHSGSSSSRSRSGSRSRYRRSRSSSRKRRHRSRSRSKRRTSSSSSCSSRSSRSPRRSSHYRRYTRSRSSSSR